MSSNPVRAVGGRAFLVVLVAIGSAGESKAQVPQALAITAPAAGTVVTPGASVTVTVSSPAGLTFSRVVIGGDDLHVGAAVPFSAEVVVPDDAASGRFEIGAMGVTSAGEVVEAKSLLLDVERQGTPTALSTESRTLRFRAPGYDLPIRIRATYEDGRVVDVTESARV